MSTNQTFLASNLLPFSIGNNTRNSSGFSLQNGGQSRQSQIDMLHCIYHFLKTLNLGQNFYSRVIQILFTGMHIITQLFHQFCWLALVYKFHFATKRGWMWNSIVKPGPEDICHFNDRTFYLKFDVSRGIAGKPLKFGDRWDVGHIFLKKNK